MASKDASNFGMLHNFFGSTSEGLVNIKWKNNQNPIKICISWLLIYWFEGDMSQRSCALQEKNHSFPEIWPKPPLPFESESNFDTRRFPKKNGIGIHEIPFENPQGRGERKKVLVRFWKTNYEILWKKKVAGIKRCQHLSTCITFLRGFYSENSPPFERGKGGDQFDGY